MEGLDAKRIFARLQLEGEEFLLTSPLQKLQLCATLISKPSLVAFF
jgi:hypothetical protein